MKRAFFATACAAAMFVAAPASAAVTFDAATGAGFVGKGDVQVFYGWNNKQLQDNSGNVQFRYVGTSTSEVSWTCTKEDVNDQVRQQTTTTAISGVVESVERERNQVTGFLLQGYEGGSVISTSTDGPSINSCPDENSGYFLSSPAGDPVVTGGGGGLEISLDGHSWLPFSG